MPRFKLTIEYDGRPFVGWQVQDNGVSVQGVLTAAVAAFCGVLALLFVRGARGRIRQTLERAGGVGRIRTAKILAIAGICCALSASISVGGFIPLGRQNAATSISLRRSCSRSCSGHPVVMRSMRSGKLPRSLSASIVIPTSDK